MIATSRSLRLFALQRNCIKALVVVLSSRIIHKKHPLPAVSTVANLLKHSGRSAPEPPSDNAQSTLALAAKIEDNDKYVTK